MKLVKAICTSCNAELDVNPEAECLICKYCGSKFIVDRAIDTYNTSVTNNIVNNINAENVFVSTKNINSLSARGMEIVKQYSSVDKDVQSSKYLELKKIANDIIDQDKDNFYARLFMICLDDYSDDNFNICINTKNTNEQKIFVDFLDKAIRGNLWFIDAFEQNYQLSLSICLSKACNNILTLGLAYYEKVSEQNNYALELYNQFRQRFQIKCVTIMNMVKDNFLLFYYSKETVQSYEFQELSKLSSSLNVFIGSVERCLIDKSEINKVLETIYETIKNNTSIIMKYSPFYGKTLIESIYKLNNKEVNEGELKELTKVEVRNIKIDDGKNDYLVLFDNCVEVYVGGMKTKTIQISDILFLNFSTTSSVSAFTYNITSFLRYDIVFRIDETTYSLLHFNYELKLTENIMDCAVSSSINAWIIEHNIKRTDINYKDLFELEQGYNGMKFKMTTDFLPSVSNGCYIATCVYGSYDCPQVWTLRRYRDFNLHKKWYGRIFIKIYYLISPTLVKWFGNKKWFKKIWKTKLDKMVTKYKDLGYEDTPYKDLY